MTHITSAHSKSQRILFISPVPTHPTISGNRQRVRQLLNFFEHRGFDYKYLWFEQECGSEIEMISTWGDHFLKVPFDLTPGIVKKIYSKICILNSEAKSKHNSLDEYKNAVLAKAVIQEAESFQPTHVIVMYVLWSWVLDLFPKTVVKIIDTNDVLGDRHAQFIKVGITPEWWSLSRRDEARGLDRANYIIGIQENESEYFRKISKAKVLTIGYSVNIQVLPEPSGSDFTFLFIGSDNPSNINGIQWFLKKCWPKIIERNASTRLLIAGKVCNKVVKVYPGVELLGIVDKPADAYKRCHVIVNPLQFGTGLKIKAIEAMSFGRPMISTRCGAEGLDDFTGAFLLADGAEEFVELCLHVIDDLEMRDNIAKAAVHCAEKMNTMNTINLNFILS